MAHCDINFSGSRSGGGNPKRLGTLTLTRESTLPSYFESEYKEELVDALEVIETDVLLRKPIHWNLLLDVVRQLRINGETAPSCFKLLKEIFSLFERHKCKDINVMSEVFLIALFLSAYNPEAEYLPGIIVHKNKSKALPQLYFCRTPYIAIHNFNIPSGIGKIHLDFVWTAARRGDLGLLKLLLKFGLGMAIPDDSYFYYMESNNDILQRLASQNSGIDRTELRRIREEIGKISELNSDYNFDFDSLSWKRMCIVLKVLEIVGTMQCFPEYKGLFIECYRLLFDSIPEAYVTSVEVKTSLEKYLPDTCDTCSNLVSKVTEDFQRLLPELADVPQPRSLQHLCRIEVRQRLRENLNLPHGVSSLPLPAKLKDYITLHDDGDYNAILRRDVDTLYARLFGRAIHDTNLYFCWFFQNGHEAPPISVMTVPEGDDCVISFLKKL